MLNDVKIIFGKLGIDLHILNNSIIFPLFDDFYYNVSETKNSNI